MGNKTGNTVLKICANIVYLPMKILAWVSRVSCFLWTIIAFLFLFNDMRWEVLRIYFVVLISVIIINVFYLWVSFMVEYEEPDPESASMDYSLDVEMAVRQMRRIREKWVRQKQQGLDYAFYEILNQDRSEAYAHYLKVTDKYQKLDKELKEGKTDLTQEILDKWVVSALLPIQNEWDKLDSLYNEYVSELYSNGIDTGASREVDIEAAKERALAEWR